MRPSEIRNLSEDEIAQKETELREQVFRLRLRGATGQIENKMKARLDKLGPEDEDALRRLGDDALSLLLFPVDRPELFDAVRTDAAGRVIEIQVKRPNAASSWIWGAFKLSGRAFAELHELWLARERRDEYIGTLVNAWLAAGGSAVGVRAGEAYVDVGTLHGYREAITMLGARPTGCSVAFRPDAAVTT